eukprot:1139524-Pelagomonas_calceolata.AAC.12
MLPTPSDACNLHIVAHSVQSCEGAWKYNGSCLSQLPSSGYILTHRSSTLASRTVIEQEVPAAMASRPAVLAFTHHPHVCAQARFRLQEHLVAAAVASWPVAAPPPAGRAP